MSIKHNTSYKKILKTQILSDEKFQRFLDPTNEYHNDYWHFAFHISNILERASSVYFEDINKHLKVDTFIKTFFDILYGSKLTEEDFLTAKENFFKHLHVNEASRLKIQLAHNLQDTSIVFKHKKPLGPKTKVLQGKKGTLTFLDIINFLYTHGIFTNQQLLAKEHLFDSLVLNDDQRTYLHKVVESIFFDQYVPELRTSVKKTSSTKQELIKALRDCTIENNALKNK